VSIVGLRDDHQSPQLREFLMKNEQQAARRQSPEPAPLPRDATENLSGLDQVRGMRDGTFGIAPMQALMNMRLIEAEEGLVVFTAVPEEKHYNPQGTVHGAFATAILDSAMGLAVVTKLPVGMSQTTVEFKLSFIRPMSSQTGEVRGEGRVIHCGRSIATAEGRLFGREGKLIAHGTATCMIFRPPRVAPGRS
jgi:uncharacterized protein (TIGR00369 family)